MTTTFSLLVCDIHTLPPLQEVQLQRLVQGHEVSVIGDPPERHVVLQTRRQEQPKNKRKCQKQTPSSTLWSED